MTLPVPLPHDHPRVEKFRDDLEIVVAEAFEAGVHIGILIANAHRAAAMMSAGLGVTRDQFMVLAENAWTCALHECQVTTALHEAEQGNGAKA